MSHRFRLDGEHRRRHLDAIEKRLPAHLERLSWSTERLKSEQQAGLQKILAFAIENSNWHRKRLAGIDIAGITDADLTGLPIMTKRDVMANWDEIVTDSRLTLKGANDHITAKLRDPDTDYYYQGDYEIFATGGSTGTRGVFVSGWEEFIEIACSTFRYQMRDEPSESLTGDRLLAVVEAGETVHGSPFVFSVSPDPKTRVDWFPANTRMKEMVAQLNAAQPTHINGFSSTIQELASEAVVGNLKISPTRVTTNSEPLLPETRAAVKKAWGVEINNMWGCVEVGLIGIECDAHEGMHLSDDMVICEFVDHHNQATTDPDRIEKILATSLFNTTLPMIRYEISDIAIPALEPCRCGAAFPLIKEIRGRADDAFKYSENVTIHPLVFRTPLGQNPMIQDYQVYQTENGARISIVKIGDIDDILLTADLVAALEAQGMKNPEIALVYVDAVKRHVETGKLRRFVPL
jgi:phenylacetate-CoA ligase